MLVIWDGDEYEEIVKDRSSLGVLLPPGTHFDLSMVV